MISLKQEINDVHLQLSRANKDLAAGKFLDLSKMDIKIKNLTTRLQSEITNLNEHERDDLLKELKSIIDEIENLEKNCRDNPPPSIQPDSTNVGKDNKE